MEKPTLKEAVDFYRRSYQPSISLRLGVVIQALEKMSKLYEWSCLKATTYSDDGSDSFEDGFRFCAQKVTSYLENVGIHSLCEDTKPTLPKIGQEWT